VNRAIVATHTLGLLTLAACAPSADTRPDTAASPTVTASAPAGGIPAGTYTTTLTKADLAGRVPAEEVDSLVGVWTQTHDSTGRFVVRWKGTQVVEAVAKPMPGDQIYLDDKDTGPYACHLPATYRYSVSGDSLSFVKVSDECAGRAAVLTAHPHMRER